MKYILSVILLTAATCDAAPPPRVHHNLERLTLPRLKSVHEDVMRLKAQRINVPPMPELTDFRCILHAHAEDSAHTGGTLPEMLTDAKRASVSAILLTDHFRPPRDFIDGRWRGMKEGVLFIPGSEARGFLLYPAASILDRMEQPTPGLITTVTANNGLIFLSHIEERPDHSVAGLSGMEIYNRHWDAKKDQLSLLAFATKLTDPAQLTELQETVRLYPDEVLAFQCDYPQVYLDKWDKGTQTTRLTGVAANDCHHNQIMLVKMVDAESVLIGTNVDKDEQMRLLTAEQRPGIRQMTKGRNAGDILAKLDLDPYFRSFANSATHVLAPRLDEAAIRAALKAGHAFVAHDWMSDASGFRFEAIVAGGERAAVMGDEIKSSDGLKLYAKLPLPAFIRMLRGGTEILTADGKADIEFEVKDPGVYRLEAWLKLDGELRPWIYSNPIYIR